jgi:hypothetical protein
MRCSVDYGTALEANSHAAKGAARLSGYGDSAGSIREQHCGGHGCASRDLAGNAIDVDGQ